MRTHELATWNHRRAREFFVDVDYPHLGGRLRHGWRHLTVRPRQSL